MHKLPAQKSIMSLQLRAEIIFPTVAILAALLIFPPVSVSARSASGSTFRVMDYGAKCDGATDDTAAIQAAETAREAAGTGTLGGGTLLFPSGICMISGAIHIRKGGRVVGTGSGSQSTIDANTSVIRTTSKSLDVFDVSMTIWQGIVFRKLRIDSPTYGDHTGGAGIRVRPTGELYVNLFRVDSVSITNMYYGIEALNIMEFSITNNFIYDFQGDGIHIAMGPVDPHEQAGDGAISRNTIWADHTSGAARAAIHLDPVGGVRISGNHLLGANFGLYLTASQGPTGTFNLSSNYIDDQKVAGVYLQQTAAGKAYGNIVITRNEFASTEPTLQGGVIFTPGWAGPYLKFAVIANNSFSLLLSQYAIINLQDGVGTTIYGNTINNNGATGAFGIMTGSNSSNVNIAANTFSGIPSGNYGPLGSGTTIQ